MAHQNRSITPEAMVAEIEDRIEYLRGVQEMIMYAFYGRDQRHVEEAPVKQAKVRKRATVSRPHNAIANTVLVEDILREASTTLNTHEIHAAMQARGWKTTSKRPINVIYQTVNQLVKNVTIAKQADGKWGLTGRSYAPEAPLVAAA